jgi:hypothetical protein
MDRIMGKILIAIGAIVVMAGVLLLFKDQIPGVRHFGRLPGDIVVHRRNFSLYFPVATSIVISIILTLIVFIFNKFR